MFKYIATFIFFILLCFIVVGNCSNEGETIDDIPYVSEQSQTTERGKQDAEAKQNYDIKEIEDESKEYPYNENSIELAKCEKGQKEQILGRAGYVTSYNCQTRNANWVAWHLTKEHTDGPWKRKGIPYLVDNAVKGERQELEDWYDTNLPIDHGHLCPAGDNKWSKEAMIQSFLLTNMCPQNRRLNQGDWEKLESRCRGWARHYGDIYIAAGPIFNGKHQTIGENKVGVPNAFFKVVLRLGDNPEALGFIYPNEEEHHDMKDYVKTVDEIEKVTGIDFFYNLPDSIENIVESNSNFKKW